MYCHELIINFMCKLLISLFCFVLNILSYEDRSAFSCCRIWFFRLLLILFSLKYPGCTCKIWYDLPILVECTI